MRWVMVFQNLPSSRKDVYEQGARLNHAFQPGSIPSQLSHPLKDDFCHMLCLFRLVPKIAD